VNRVSETETRYIESGPENEDGTGQNIARDTPTLHPSNANTLTTHFGEPRRVKPEVLSCMTQAVLNWNAANIQYNPLGPNSNSFASWILHECGAPALPNALARPLGWAY
jgi:hypothetical protein